MHPLLLRTVLIISICTDKITSYKYKTQKSEFTFSAACLYSWTLNEYQIFISMTSLMEKMMFVLTLGTRKLKV